MSYGSLSLTQSPPALVPLSFMLTAPLFSLLAGVIIFIYPESMQSRWTPETLSVTHLLVLGFAVMVMLGAIQQLLPVLVGVSFKHPVAISISVYAGFTFGVLCLCLGLLNSWKLMLVIALVSLTLTIGFFLVMVGSAVLRSRANPGSIHGIRFALAGFLISVALGLYLGAGHGLEDIALQRQYTQVHLAWGLLGWIGLLIISVSYQVVPMFQITPKYPDFMLRWLVPGIFTGLGAWSILKVLDVNGLYPDRGAVSVVEVFVTLGYVSFCVMTLILQSRRKRKLPDITLNYFRLGLVAMLAAMVCWWLPISIVNRWISADLLLAVLLIIGFTMSIISGMLYKIVPFLIWLHLTNKIDMSSRSVMDIPNMKQIIPDLHARWQLRFHGITLLLMIVALCQIPWVIKIAGLSLVFSSGYLLRNLLYAILLYQGIAGAELKPDGEC